MEHLQSHSQEERCGEGQDNFCEKSDTHPIDESIKDIEKSQEAFNQSVAEAAKDSEDVKDGISTEEEEINAPGNVLFNKISETAIQILKSPSIKKSFDIIAPKLGVEESSVLVNLLVMCMTNASYNAIVFYDELLKNELTKQFNHIGDHVNSQGADIEGIKSSIEVFQKKLGNIENVTIVKEAKETLGEE